MPPPLMFYWEIYEFFRSSHRRCCMKKAVLKNFAILAENLQACNFIKNNPAQMFSSEYVEIFKSIYFEEHLHGEQLHLY